MAEPLTVRQAAFDEQVRMKCAALDEAQRLRRMLRAAGLDPDGDPLSCWWEIDDGDGGSVEWLEHDFSGDGRTCVNCYTPEPDNLG